MALNKDLDLEPADFIQSCFRIGAKMYQPDMTLLLKSCEWLPLNNASHETHLAYGRNSSRIEQTMMQAAHMEV